MCDEGTETARMQIEEAVCFADDMPYPDVSEQEFDSPLLTDIWARNVMQTVNTDARTTVASIVIDSGATSSV